MKIVFFSANIETIKEWEITHSSLNNLSCYDTSSLTKILNNLNEPYILIADYDTVAHSINAFISSNKLPKNTIVLEKVPEISSGKILISHGVKAYGNTRMFPIHYKQMIRTVKNEKVWTYPELTATLVESSKKTILNDDAKNLVQNRLTAKETEVLHYILDGFINDAIASQMNITTRTVKAHISAIFSKLHVNDRVSLILLLK